jgi:protein-S-isoprenylcysteine O-methyltransferase Ste14
VKQSHKSEFRLLRRFTSRNDNNALSETGKYVYIYLPQKFQEIIDEERRIYYIESMKEIYPEKPKVFKNKWTKNDIFWCTLLTILCIACFPVNPLVLFGILVTGHNQMAYIIGWVVWVFGMVLVIAPIIMFPRRGGVEKGKSFVHTTRLVDTRIYSIVRHPQYLGGIFAIFITTILWYPHWLFCVLGVVGAVVVYMSCREEDQRLILQFGEDYKNYMQKVPGMNFLIGIIHLIQRRKR